MKKLIAIVLVLILAFSLAACGVKDAVQDTVRDALEGGGSADSAPSSQGNDEDETEPPDNTEDEPDETLESQNNGSDEAVDIVALVGKTIDNERLVLISNEAEDHLYGEESHYLFLTFDEENKIDQFGDAGSYYVFADEASFDVGLEEMGSYKGSNRTSLFIHGYTVFPNDWPGLTFAEIVERIETDSGKDNYSAYYDIVR